MGGYGSGAYQSDSAKELTEHTPHISISKLYRAGIVASPSTGRLTYGKETIYFTFESNRLMLIWAKYLCQIKIEQTPLYFGGVRNWFSCPDCQKRAGLLYLDERKHVFLCRHCADLTYQSTRKPKKTVSRDDKVAARRAKVERMLSKYASKIAQA